MTGDSIDPIAVALAVVHTLDSLGVASTIGGSIASSFAGEPRSTIDIDYLRTHAPSIDGVDLLERALTSGDAAGP